MGRAVPLRDDFDAGDLRRLARSGDDPRKVRRLLADQRSVAQGRQELGEVLLLNRLEAMSAEERAAYADRLEKGLRSFRKR